ncbi:hypothetical protein [Actinomarinicola tropica]|uniref:DUF305 domain-containing protein n=1 Tax=Actinomarinicola tropica TaxID=2789776 RepID=A0A5Q2RGA7_9ACTN|nr:hypothetical protein [Actinomarinicola tropica]QGG94674.1 hypothetical protein GH723_05870 [Actinomarinicola tropica]
MTTRALRLLAAVLAAVLLAAACGGDDDGDDATTTTSAEEAEEETTTTSEAEEETTTTSEETTETTEEAGGTTGGTLDLEALADVDDFCELESFGDDIDDAIFDDTAEEPATPEQMQASFDAMSAFLTRANQIAPEEIRADFALVSEGFLELIGLMAEYDYDFMALGMAAQQDPELAQRLELLESPEYQQASENVDAWIDANCGD